MTQSRPNKDPRELPAKPRPVNRRPSLAHLRLPASESFAPAKRSQYRGALNAQLLPATATATQVGVYLDSPSPPLHAPSPPVPPALQVPSLGVHPGLAAAEHCPPSRPLLTRGPAPTGHPGHTKYQSTVNRQPSYTTSRLPIARYPCLVLGAQLALEPPPSHTHPTSPCTQHATPQSPC